MEESRIDDWQGGVFGILSGRGWVELKDITNELLDVEGEEHDSEQVKAHKRDNGLVEFINDSNLGYQTRRRQ